MALDLIKLRLQPIRAAKPSITFPLSKSHFPSLPFHSDQRLLHQHHSRVAFSPPVAARKPISIQFSLSSSTPPTSKEEAILQAKTCLSSTLEKPLNNPKLVGKLKKLRQPRFRVEIPIIDDSPASLSQLAFEFFQDLPVKRKGFPVKVLLLWPNLTLTEAAIDVFGTQTASQIEHMDLSSVNDSDSRILNSIDAAIFLAPGASQLAVIRSVTANLYPKPVVIFNPKWAFEEESNLGELGGFVGSFEVIYSFMGLEVRGILSSRKGMIFKCVRDGVVSGERWAVLVEEEGGELKVISRFKTRPSIGEVENVLYNLMVINSPITKSAKFLRDLVSNVTGKK